MRKHKCVQCGQCCISVGSTFWVSEEGFGGYPELQEWANASIPKGDNAMPCEMLNIEGGTAICYIEECFGHEAKPLACQEHPEGDELCQREKLFKDNDNEQLQPR